MPIGEQTLVVYEITVEWKDDYKIFDVEREIKVQAKPKGKVDTVLIRKEKKVALAIKFKTSDYGNILSKEELEEILHPLKITELLVYRNEDLISDGYRILGAFALSLIMVFTLINLVHNINIYSINITFNNNRGVVFFAVFMALFYFLFSYAGYEKPIEIIDSYGKGEKEWMPLNISNIKRNAKKLLVAAEDVNDPKLTFFLTASALEETAKYLVEKLIYDSPDAKQEKEIVELKQKIYEDHLYKYRVGFLSNYIVEVINLDTAMSNSKTKKAVEDARKVKDLRDSYLSTNMRSKFSIGEYINYQKMTYKVVENLLKKSDRLLNRKDRKEILLKLHSMISK